jgi:hypothetical protein
MRGYSTDRRSVRVVGWVRNFAKASQIRSPLFRQVSAPSSCCSGVPKAFPARTAWMVKAGLERLRLGVRSLAWQSFLEVSVQPVLIFDGGLSPIGPFTRRREPMNRSSPSTGSDRKSSLKLLFPRGSLTKSASPSFIQLRLQTQPCARISHQQIAVRSHQQIHHPASSIAPGRPRRFLQLSSSPCAVCSWLVPLNFGEVGLWQHHACHFALQSST